MEYLVFRAKIKRGLPLIISVFILLIGLGIGLVLIGKPQIFKKQAAGICPVESTVCQWDYSQDLIGTITFNYQIVDLTTGETVKSGTTQATRITFTPLVDHRYSCKITPSSTCGNGPERVALNTCTSAPQPTATPTPPVTPTSTPLPTVTQTPGLSPTPSATGTPGPSPTSAVTPTLMPSNVGTGTLTPTPEITPSATPTQAVGAPAPTSTSTPLAENLPESATTGPTLYLISLSFLLIALGLKFFL